MMSSNPLIMSHSRASPKLVSFWISSPTSLEILNKCRGVDWGVSETLLICWLFAVLGGDAIGVGVTHRVGFII